MIALTLSFMLCLPMINSPLMLSLGVILLSLNLSIMCSFKQLSWFAFIIFLVYIGGMLVIFMYFSSLIPNQKINMMMPIMMFTLVFMSYFFLSDNHTMKNMTTQMNFMKPDNIMLTSPNYTLYLFMAAFLFIIMVIVCKILKKNKSPLRPFN